jgi:hypothetical protein
MSGSEGMEGDRLLSNRLRLLQFMVAAMITGAVVFAVIAVVVGLQRGGDPDVPMGTPFLSYIALAFFVIELAAWAVFPRRLADRGVAAIAAGTWTPGPESNPADYAGDDAKLLAVLQTKTLAASALMEGAAFLGCIAYLVEGQAIALAATAGAVLVMAATFPTLGRLRGWLETQRARVEELRRQGEAA